MKNNILFVLFSVIVGFSTTSCTDWLNIKPENEIILDDYWKTKDQAQAVVTACYRGLISDDVMYRLIAWGELRSDNVTPIIYDRKLEDLYRTMLVDITPENAYASWAPLYQIINNCNTFLHFAPNVVNQDQNFTEGDLHELEAEVLTIRSLCYFYLVRTFKDIPWVETPSIDDSQNYLVAQSSESLVLQNIIRDLKIARKYISVSSATPVQDKGLVTLKAVNALLADVYLWNQDYANCVSVCDDVLEDSELKLVTANDVLYDVYLKGSSTESIFELQFSNVDVQANTAVNTLYGTWAFGGGLIGVPSNISTLDDKNSPFNYTAGDMVESETDYRQKDFLRDYGSYIYIFKYRGALRSEDASGISTYSWRGKSSSSNWIVYKLSDVMLMKAEALTQLNRSDNDLKEAIKLVNTTYLRSNPASDSLSFSNYSSKVGMASLVMRERRRELMFEGKRWFDLVRAARRDGNTDQVVAALSPNLHSEQQLSNISVMNALYMPINKTEMDVNPKLVQNPFYTQTGSTKKNK